MALSSTNIANKAVLLLQDATNIRWSIPEMAKWINAGTKELVLMKPTALTANVSMLLAAGTKQSLIGATFIDSVTGVATAVSPIQLLEVTRNMGIDGKEASAGDAITGVDRKQLDVTLPNWHSITGSASIKHFMFDPKADTKTFYVYPKAVLTTTPITAWVSNTPYTAGTIKSNGGKNYQCKVASVTSTTAPPSDTTSWVEITSDNHVEVVISRSPINTLSDSASAFGLNDIDAGIDDIYENVIVDYVLYRAYSKDSRFTANMQRSQWHYQAFQAALGVKLKNEITMAPDQQFQQEPQPQPQG